ncbi:MAG: 3-keto-5-aminohexanoate cleavage protein [Bacillota bacterium]|nr:3-keto-5-aminohexanoate cleavage protein [Bacillota bacterium]
MENKVIITAALTGAVTPKEINENIPLTPVEIAEDAYRCWKAGAAIVHLHMRDDNGFGTMDKEKFRETIELIKAYEDCDVVINCTSSGAKAPTDEERMAHIKELKPEIASFDAGTFNWMPNVVFMNSPQFLEKLGVCLQETGVKPEIEIFDSGMMGITKYYVKKGILPAGPTHFQFVLGVLGGMAATVDNLLVLKNQLPEDATWSAFGIGAGHMPIMYATLALGGHLRVGLEDNVYFSKGVKATNVQLVERAVNAIKVFGKEVATPDEARKILGISK